MWYALKNNLHLSLLRESKSVKADPVGGTVCLERAEIFGAGWIKLELCCLASASRFTNILNPPGTVWVAGVMHMRLNSPNYRDWRLSEQTR